MVAARTSLPADMELPSIIEREKTKDALLSFMTARISKV